MVMSLSWKQNDDVYVMNFRFIAHWSRFKHTIKKNSLRNRSKSENLCLIIYICFSLTQKKRECFTSHLNVYTEKYDEKVKKKGKVYFLLRRKYIKLLTKGVKFCVFRIKKPLIYAQNNFNDVIVYCFLFVLNLIK